MRVDVFPQQAKGHALPQPECEGDRPACAVIGIRRGGEQAANLVGDERDDLGE